jgi:hypothetical protein
MKQWYGLPHRAVLRQRRQRDEEDDGDGRTKTTDIVAEHADLLP